MALPSTHQFYKIKFFDACIQTTVTTDAAVVDKWISNTYNIHNNRLHSLVVGLDTEWQLCMKPNGHQPVAIIQLCVGHRCLIFRFFHAKIVPLSLINFLSNPNFTFSGVGVEQDKNKLLEDWGLVVGCTMDIACVVAKRYKDPVYKHTGLKRLELEFTGRLMQKPKHITLSKWDNEKLNFAQVKYASIDAFASFELGLQFYKFYRDEESKSFRSPNIHQRRHNYHRDSSYSVADVA